DEFRLLLISWIIQHFLVFHHSLPIQAILYLEYGYDNKCHTSLPFLLSDELELLPISGSFPLFRTLHHLPHSLASLRSVHGYDILHYHQLYYCPNEFQYLLIVSFYPLFQTFLHWIQSLAIHHFVHAYDKKLEEAILLVLWQVQILVRYYWYILP